MTHTYTHNQTHTHVFFHFLCVALCLFLSYSIRLYEKHIEALSLSLNVIQWSPGVPQILENRKVSWIRNYKLVLKMLLLKYVSVSADRS